MSIKEKKVQQDQAIHEYWETQAHPERMAPANVNSPKEPPKTRYERLELLRLEENKISQMVHKSKIREIFSEAARLTKGKIDDDLSGTLDDSEMSENDARAQLIDLRAGTYHRHISLTWSFRRSIQDGNFGRGHYSGGDTIKDSRGGLLDFVFHGNEVWDEVRINADVFSTGVSFGAVDDKISAPDVYKKDILEGAVLDAINAPTPTHSESYNGNPTGGY